MKKHQTKTKLLTRVKSKHAEELPDNKKLQIISECILRYYEIYDMDNGTIHSQVFTMLYLSDKHYTYSQICDRLYISKNTLIRYIEKYNKLAIKIQERLNL